MFKKMALCLLSLLLLSGCQGLGANIEDLMQPPKLTAEQSEIYAALEAAAGTDRLILKYPQSGSYRSAFVFRDIDGDGQEEALAFYSTESKEGGTWVNVLDRIDGRWVSVQELAGSGSDIDYVDFAHISGRRNINILIGWNYGNFEEKSLAVYSYGERGLVELLSERYVQALIHDIEGDGQDEILLATPNSQGRSYLKLIAEQDGAVTATGQVFLEENITGYEQILTGQLDPARSGVVLDVCIGEKEYATLAVAFENGGLTALLRDETTMDYILPHRSQRLLSRDIDGDGIIELPAGLEQTSALPAPYRLFPLACYQKIVNNTLQPVMTAAVHLEGNYMLRYPARWEGRVFAVSAEQSNQLRFVIPNERNPAQPIELLSIVYYDQNTPQDLFQAEDYRRLERRGLMEYYAAVAQRPDDPLALSWEELQTLFDLI